MQSFNQTLATIQNIKKKLLPKAICANNIDFKTPFGHPEGIFRIYAFSSKCTGSRWDEPVFFNTELGVYT
jgi:hypothetical protein